MAKDKMEAIQHIALYTILVDMIHQNRIGIMEAVSILEKSGLTTEDYDTWNTEDGREIHFQIPFPTFKLENIGQRHNPYPYCGC